MRNKFFKNRHKIRMKEKQTNERKEHESAKGGYVILMNVSFKIRKIA